RREQCQRVKCRSLVVVGELAAARAHAVGVDTIASPLVAGTEELFDRIEIALLARRRCLRPPQLARRRQPRQRGARFVGLFVIPEGLVVAQRLAPERQREARIAFLCLAERVDRVVVLEAVKKENAANETWLRGRRSGIREGDLTE